MKKLLTFIVAAAFAAACSQGVVDKNKDSQQNGPAAEQGMPANPHGDAQADPHAGAKKERKINVPKEVSDKYKSLIIEVKDLKKNTTVQSDILIGQKADVAGTPFSVQVEYYMPDFVIDTDGTITTRSAEEKNPVAKIKVFKDGKVYFDGWLFKAHPEEHGAFQDANYGMSIVKSVQK